MVLNITSLPDDIINNMCRNLMLKDIYSWFQVCTKYRLATDDYYCDLMWYDIACREYSSEFWERALKRNKKISLPEGSFYKELKRLKKFEGLLLKEGLNRYTIDEYYFYWESLES